MKKAKKQNQKNISVAILVLLLVAVMATAVLFAYFSADMNISNDFGSAGNLSVDVSVSSNATAGTFAFQTAGSTYRAEIKVFNNNVTNYTPPIAGAVSALEPTSRALSYSFKLSGILDKTLRDALILKLDGKVFGMLSAFYDEVTEQIVFGTDFILAEGATRTHVLELELHIGAGRQFENTQNTIKIAIEAHSFVENNYLFVTTAEEFLQAIRQENHTAAQNKTIYLVKDIDLKSYAQNTILTSAVSGGVVPLATDIVVNSNFNLELNGKTLALNHGIIFNQTEAGVATISSQSSGGKITFSGTSPLGLVVESTKAYVDFKNILRQTDAPDGQNSIFIAPLTIKTVQGEGLSSAVLQQMKGAIKNGVGAQALDVLGNFSPYFTNNIITFTAQDNLLEVSQFPKLKSTLQNLPTQIFAALQVTVNGSYSDGSTVQTTMVSVRLNSQKMALESLLDNAMNESCAYLNSSRIDNAPAPARVPAYDVNRNLYLPTEVRSLNASIEWISSDLKYLSSSGKYLPAPLDKEVELAAIISYQGERFVRKYKLNIKALPPNERLQEICLLNPIVFVAPSKQPLIDPLKYAEFNLTNITYTLKEEDKAYFTIDLIENVLILTKAPPGDNLFTTITVRAKLNGVDAECPLDVAVKIDRSIPIIDEAHRYAQTFIAALGESTFLNFNLPSKYYDSVGIVYEIIAGSFSIDPNTYQNPADVANYIKIAVDSTGNAIVDANGNILVEIDPQKVPMQNTLLHIKATYTHKKDGVVAETASRVLIFMLSGIIHNNAKEINDPALYIKLLNVVDTNHDYFITADEANSVPISSLLLTHAGLSDLKGLEYFKLVGTLDLSYNNIYDVSYLSNLIDLKQLDLSHNKIGSIENLKNLSELTVLKLSGNLLTDITDLQNLTGLKELYVDNNTNLADISCILNMQSLGYLSAYASLVKSYPENNLNAILTAYIEYQAHNAGTTPKYYIENATNFYKIPSLDYNKANAAINKIVPIYEFANVIYLLPKIGEYAVRWTTSHPSIVQIDTAGNKAYILQPLSNVDITLTAEITFAGSQKLQKKFEVLSVGANVALTVYSGTAAGGQPIYVDAKTAIPDDNLRYLLFLSFDSDKNKQITKAEIDGFINENIIDFSNKNIKDIQGLKYFTSLKKIDLSNNMFTDLTPILPLAMLTDLVLINCKANLSVLSTFQNALSALTVFGSVTIDDPLSVSALVQIFNRLPQGGKIYKNDLKKEWNPYPEELNRAMTQALGTVVLTANSAGEKVTLITQISWNMFGQTPQTSLNISYTINSGNLITLVGNVVSIKEGSAPAEDSYATLTAKMKYRPTSTSVAIEVSQTVLVYVRANHELMVETEQLQTDGSHKTALLSEVVKDSVARKMILAAVSAPLATATNKNLITRAMLGNVTALTFNCDTPYGLQGIEIFSGLNLHSVTIIGGSDTVNRVDNTGVVQKQKLLDPLNSISASLQRLRVERSFVDLTCLKNMESLTELSLYRCPKIVLEADGINALDQLTAAPVFPAMTTLMMFENSISNLTPVSKLKKVKTMHLYGNIASVLYSTDRAMNECYSNFVAQGGTTYDYLIINTTTQWLPNIEVSNSITSLDVTYATEAAPTVKKTVTADVFKENYIGAGKLYLPQTYNSYTVVWETKFTTTLNISTALQDGQYVATVVPQAVDAYVVLSGTLSALKKTISYYFVVKGTVASNANYVNLGLFMKGGKLIDPYFTFYCYQLLQTKNTANTTGIYTVAEQEKVTQFDFPNPKDKLLKYEINAIDGIQNFTKIREIWIKNTQISDITPIKSMASVVDIDLRGNNISTLWSGAESVFINMTGLISLQLSINKNIADYSAICYTNNTRNKARVGLGDLKTLAMESTADSGKGLDTIILNSTHYYETLAVWFAARKKKDQNYADTKFYFESYSHTGTNILKDEIINSLVWGVATIDEAGNVAFAPMIDEKIPQIAESYLLAYSGVKYQIEVPSTLVYGGSTYTLQYESIARSQRSWLTYDNITATLSVFETAEVSALGGQISMRGYLENNGFMVYRNFILDSTVLNTTTPYVEITSEEKAVYQTSYRLNDKDFKASAVYQTSYRLNDKDFKASDANFIIEASKIIPDYNLARLLFKVFDTTRDFVLTIAERGVKPLDGKLQIEGQGVTSLNGLELFPLITNLVIKGNRLEVLSKLPKLPQLPNTTPADLSITLQDPYLLSLEGIGSFGSRLKSLTIMSFGSSIAQQNANYIKDLTLTKLSIYNVGISDYSFLLGNLTNTLTELSVKSPSDMSHHMFYNNKNIFTEVLFETSNNGNGLKLLDNNGEVLFTGFDAKEQPVYNYLKKAKKVAKGATTVLDSTFNAFGKSYGVEFSAVAGSNYTLSADKKSITIPQNFAGESFEIVAQVTYGGKKTFKQQITCYFAASKDSSVVEYIGTEGTIVHGGVVTNLATLVPDIGLRYALFQLIDKNRDQAISQAELDALRTNNNVSLGEVDNNSVGWLADSPRGVPIASFEGIGILNNYITSLILVGISTYDLSPLAELTQLESLDIRTSYVTIQDWKFLTGLKKFKYLKFNWDTWGNGLEVLMDSDSLFSITKGGIAVPYSSLGNAIAYLQSVKNFDNYESGEDKVINSYPSMRADQKLAALILDALDLNNLLNAGSCVQLKNQTAGTVALPGKIHYQSDTFAMEYIALTSNLSFANGANGATMTVKSSQNNKKARFLVRTTINNALYERYLEFQIV